MGDRTGHDAVQGEWSGYVQRQVLLYMQEEWSVYAQRQVLLYMILLNKGETGSCRQVAAYSDHSGCYVCTYRQVAESDHQVNIICI